MITPADPALASYGASVPENSGRRSALIVGVNGSARSTYLSPLQAAEDDARAIGQTLQGIGCCRFNVTFVLGGQASAAEVRRAIGQLKRSSTPDDELLFYFSGHALPLQLPTGRVETFFCTSDFADDEARDDPSLFFSMSWLYENLYETPDPGSVCIILDCCFAGNIVGAGPDPLVIDMREVIKHYKQRSDLIAQATYNSRLRFILAATGHSQQAAEREGHGLLTQHLLQLLEGRGAEIWGGGLVTPQTLLDYAQAKMPKEQQPSSISINHRRFVVADRSAAVRQSQEERQHTETELQRRQAAERERRLQALLHDHSGFIEDRLASFVGRTQELAEIRSRIAEKFASGGYVTITGQAGQGKSSIIAKLVQEYGLENMAHHFIPFNPGPDHQVGLLRNLMARLILKYNLSDIYVSSDSRPALRDYFPRVLQEVVAQGGHEVIFIDGLDQLEEDVSGMRDLSFLPVEPPEGVVFVLGTRPDDTLKPLELLKPRHEYRLPNLSRADFDLILQRYQVELDATQAEQFYTAMGENALYLDLVAKELKELAEIKALRPEEVIRRLADNPDNLFSLAMDRLKRVNRQWREVNKPILGVLLAAREPLRLRAVRQIIGQDEESVRDGLQRLGGLVARDGRDRYYLYHLKLYDYMRQDPQRPDKSYVFADDEEEGWHQRLAAWCTGVQGGLAAIWEDTPGNAAEQDRRTYTREHYIAHLYLAKNWHELWQVLDAGAYGRAKLHHNPSTRGYALDLDFGRQAAARPDLSPTEGLGLLSTLWRYSLLRCSLASQADNCNLDIFESLVTLGREREAIGLIELMTDASRKAMTLAMLGNQLARRSRMQEGQQLLTRAIEVAHTIENADERLGTFLVIAALAILSAWPEQARAILDDLTPAVERLVSVEVRAGMLLGIGALTMLCQSSERAHTIIDAVRPLITELLKPAMQVAVQLGVVALEVLSGRTEHIEAVLEDTRAIIRRLGVGEALNSEELTFASVGIAALAVLGGQPERVSHMLDELYHAVQTNVNDDNDATRLLSLLLVAATYFLNKQPERVDGVLRDVLQIIQQTSEPQDRGLLVMDFPEFLEARSFAWKYLFLEDMTALAAHIWEIPALAQLRTLLQVVVTQCQLPATAVATLEVLECWLPSLESPERADDVRRILALLYAQGRMAERAIPIATAISEPGARANVLINIARYLTDGGAVEQAQKLLESALDAARQVTRESQRAECMAMVVWELLQRRAIAASQPILDEATAAARSIVDDQQRVRIFRHIAVALSRAGRRDDALALLEKAALVARAIRNVEERAAVLQDVATAFFYTDCEQTTIGLLSEAATAARTIDRDYRRGEVLGRIGTILSAMGKREEAAAIAGDARLQPSSGLEEVIATMTRTGRLDDALAAALLLMRDERQRILQQITHAFIQAGRLGDILDAAKSAASSDEEAIRTQVILSLVPAGRLDEVLSAASQVGSHPLQERMLDQSADVIATMENLDDVLAVIRAKMVGADLPRMFLRLVVSLARVSRFDAAQKLIDQVDDRSRPYAFRQIALALTQAGRVDDALSMLERANSDAQATDDTRQNIDFLLEIATVLGRAQRYESARALLTQVIGAAHALDDREKTGALLQVAAVCIEANSPDMAGSILDEVGAQVRTMDDVSPELQLQLACNLARAGRQSEATVLFEVILSDTRSRTYTYSFQRTEAFVQIAVALAAVGRLDEAFALAAAPQVTESSYERDEIRKQIVYASARAGHLPTVLTAVNSLASYERRSAVQGAINISIQAGYLDKVIVAVPTVDDLYQRATAYVQIAQAVSRTGRPDDVGTYLEAARSTSLDLEDYRRSNILSQIATVYISAGQLNEALVIIRSIDTASIRANLLEKLAEAYARADESERVLRLVQTVWAQALTRDNLLQLAPVADTLIDMHPELGLTLAEAFTWVDDFLRG